MKTATGITLPELLTALAICAILTALGVPALGTLILDGRMTSGTNELVRSVHLGWENAQTRLNDIVICRSANSRQCAGAGDWDDGWIVFVNRDRDNPPVVDADESILAVAHPSGPLSIHSNRDSFVLRPSPFRSTNGTVVFCDRRGAISARAVIISYTGRPRVSNRTASDTALSCTS